MKTRNSLINKAVSTKTVFIMTLLCFIVLLIPMLYIANYNLASVDDFKYGAAAHRAYMETGSAAKALLAAAKGTAEVYNTWQGTYSAVFLFHLQPGVFSEQLYKITTYLMLFSLLGGLLFLCQTVFCKIFSADGLTCGTIVTAEALLCTQFVPMPAESFYWFNGSVYYTFFFGLALVSYALIIRYLKNEKRKPLLALGIILLLAFIGGGNYATALSTAELLVLAVGLLIIRKNGRWKDVTLFLAVFLVAFLISILGPGNAARGGENYLGHNVISAMLVSFKTTAKHIVGWTSLPVAALTALLVPICLSFCGETRFSFKLPAVVTIMSFCLLASMFFPPLYAQGYFPFRLENIIFFAYIFLLVFNVFYWAGWATKKAGEKIEKYRAVRLWLIAAVLVLFTVGSALMTLSGNISSIDSGYLGKKRNVTSSYVIAALVNGGAERYYEQTLERLELLEDDSIKEVELQPYDYRPGVLFVCDITEHSDEWMNIAMSRFYNKDKVWLSEPYED